MYPSESSSGSTTEFIIGNSFIAREMALIKNGRKVKSGILAFNSFLKLIKAVASISSENPNVGMLRPCVIVLVIAFYIPTIFFTSSYAVVPVSAG